MPNFYSIAIPGLTHVFPPHLVFYKSGEYAACMLLARMDLRGSYSCINYEQPDGSRPGWGLQKTFPSVRLICMPHVSSSSGTVKQFWWNVKTINLALQRPPKVR